jgi:hypothetical protein
MRLQYRVVIFVLLSIFSGIGTSSSQQKRMLIVRQPPLAIGIDGKLQFLSSLRLAFSYTSSRFRRDPEDSGQQICFDAYDRTFSVGSQESTTTRPSFRTSLTQPSQMGNFRHQSTRTSDRDREKDADKEKDRDRDTKDGLRSVSPISCVTFFFSYVNSFPINLTVIIA